MLIALYYLLNLLLSAGYFMVVVWGLDWAAIHYRMAETGLVYYDNLGLIIGFIIGLLICIELVFRLRYFSQKWKTEGK